LYGQFKRVQSHVTFVRSLEDRASFFAALENVNKKTGGVEPLGIVLTDAARQGRDPEAETAFPEQIADSTSDKRWAEREVDGESKGKAKCPTMTQPFLIDIITQYYSKVPHPHHPLVDGMKYVLPAPALSLRAPHGMHCDRNMNEIASETPKTPKSIRTRKDLRNDNRMDCVKCVK
jgi:hypothetical protein